MADAGAIVELIDFYPGGASVYAGPRTISGIVTYNGVPGTIRPRVYVSRSDGLLLDSKLVEADGTFSFSAMPIEEVVVTAIDRTDTYNARVRDRVVGG